MTIDLLIPALNEEPSIGFVLDALPHNRLRQVIVVNNGSTDQTATVAANHGAIVVNEPRRGYGQACLTGMKHLSADPPDILVFLDGDFSDDPTDIHAILKPIMEGTSDAVLGSRLMGNREDGAMSFRSVWGNSFGCWLMNRFMGGNYTDLGPFRAIRWNVLSALSMSDTNYGWTIEMQIKLLLHKFRVSEVPVSYRRRIGQAKVSGTWTGSFKASVKILKVLFYYLLFHRH